MAVLEPTPIEGVENGDSSSMRTRQLYTQFWKLQKYIVNPRRLFMAADLDIGKEIDDIFKSDPIGDAKNGGGGRPQHQEESAIERRHSQSEAIEEGQAEDIDVEDKTFVKRMVKQMATGSQQQVSNILYFLQLLEFFYSEFERLNEEKVRKDNKNHKPKQSSRSVNFNTTQLPEFTVFEEDIKSGALG